jgi:lipoprotein-anchoring transpeptidase ErfK/SrfK
VLALTGEEPRKNKGGDVDSYARGIYIHGTNDEARIGQPTSHGCVRLRNDDVIDAYRRIPVGARVLITE